MGMIWNWFSTRASSPNRRAFLRTFSLCVVLSIPWVVIHAYNVIVYTGSHIPTQRYTKLVTGLQFMLGGRNNVSIQPYTPCRRSFPNDTILIGHSFGGTFALWDANKPNVRGVVLLYSHFNSRRTMWYPGIAMRSVRPPVLTILGTDDKRLPFKCAIDDLFVKQEEVHRNKHFLVKPGYGHFSGLEQEEQDEDNRAMILASEIAAFIQSMDTYDNALQEQCMTWYHPKYKPTLPLTRDLSKSMNLIDALVMVSGLPGWWQLHFFLFLLSKPKYQENVEFTWKDSTLYKTSHVPMEKFQAFLDKEMFPTIDIDWRIIRLPSIHPAILPWLLREPKLVPSKHGSSKEWKGEMIVLPVNENVTYYRVPHRHPLLTNVSRSSLV